MKDILYNLKMKFQRFLKGYSYDDCVGLHYWMCETFPEMILTIRDHKYSFPPCDFEEVDDFEIGWVEDVSKDIIQSKVERGYEEEINLTDRFDRWALILTRIAWCLKEVERDIDNEYWDDKIFTYTDRDKWYEREMDIQSYKFKCKDEAFDLLKKYFWSLSI